MRTLSVCGGTLLTLWMSAPATAQTSPPPQTQLFVGGTHADASQLARQFATTTEDGVEISLIRVFSRWFAMQGDVTGRYGAPITTGPVVGPAQFKGTTRPSLYAVLGGPQIGWPAGRLAPFVHAGVGVAWERAGFNAVDFTSVQTDTGLAAALGGGVDVAWTHRVALRVEVDALRTAVFQGSRHHVSVSAGVRVGLGR